MLTGVVLTRNEAGQIGKCLRNLQFCDELIVVDDASTDETIKIAKQAGARVLEHELSGDYAAQRNWAISQVKSGWILFVDADEVVLSQLAKEITAAITKVECKGFWLTRTDFMWGKQLKHGDVGQVKLVRLSRKGAGQWVGKVHETWLIEGQVCSLKAPLQHYPHPTMEAFLRHINQYSTLRARELKATGVKATIWQIIFYPVFKFKHLYLLKLGFLDGTAGFVHAMTMAFYTFLTRGKLWLLAKGINEDKWSSG